MAGVLIGLAGRSVLPLIGEATLKEATGMIGKSIAIGTGSYAVRKYWEASGKKKRSKKRSKSRNGLRIKRKGHRISKRRLKHGR